MKSITKRQRTRMRTQLEKQNTSAVFLDAAVRGDQIQAELRPLLEDIRERYGLSTAEMIGILLGVVIRELSTVEALERMCRTYETGTAFVHDVLDASAKTVPGKKKR